PRRRLQPDSGTASKDDQRAVLEHRLHPVTRRQDDLVSGLLLAAGVAHRGDAQTLRVEVAADDVVHARTEVEDAASAIRDEVRLAEGVGPSTCPQPADTLTRPESLTTAQADPAGVGRRCREDDHAHHSDASQRCVLEASMAHRSRRSPLAGYRAVSTGA